MSPAAPQQFNKGFNLDASILGIDSATKFSIGVATAPDVLTAIVNNAAFPVTPTGKIELGSIAVNIDAGQAKVGFKASTGAGTGIGVYDQSKDAIASLKLPAAPGLDLTVAGGAANRFLVMSWRYNLSGPITAKIRTTARPRRRSSSKRARP